MAAQMGSNKIIRSSPSSAELLNCCVLLGRPASYGKRSTDQVLKTPAAGGTKSQRLKESNSDGLN